MIHPEDMSPGELARFALLDPDIEDGVPSCAACGASYRVPPDLEPSRFCDSCAHEILAALARALSTPPDIRAALTREFRRALELAENNKSKAARILGVSRYTVHRFLRGENVGGKLFGKGPT